MTTLLLDKIVPLDPPGAICAVIPFPRSLNDWHKALESARGEAVDATLLFAERCHEFKKACPKIQGGSSYSTNMREWFCITVNMASRWATVGSRVAYLRARQDSLAPSMEWIYRYLKLSPKQASEVTSSTSQRELTKMVYPPPPAPTVEVTPASTTVEVTPSSTTVTPSSTTVTPLSFGAMMQHVSKGIATEKYSQDRVLEVMSRFKVRNFPKLIEANPAIFPQILAALESEPTTPALESEPDPFAVIKRKIVAELQGLRDAKEIATCLRCFAQMIDPL